MTSTTPTPTVLSTFTPAPFFRYFEEISAIPRGSYHEQAISDHLVAFARDRGLSVEQDTLGSLLIKKPGTSGYENAAPLGFHGHMDMVLAKDDGVEHDMLTEGVRLRVDGDFISGTGTTLGADNGVGVAFMMALLDSTEVPHPPLEAIITVQEEVGKAGSIAFDVTNVTATRLIDFNWHDPETIFAGCAGDISAWLTLPLTWEPAQEKSTLVTVTVHGLEGGHSEFDIHRDRANAIVLTGRLLRSIGAVTAAQLVSVDAGVNRYVIPNAATLTVAVPTNQVGAVTAAVTTLGDTFRHEFTVSDPQLTVDVTTADVRPGTAAASAQSTKELAAALRLIPNGVQSNSLTTEHLVESSNTIAQIEIRDGAARILNTVPSAVSSRKYEILDRIVTVADLLGHGATVDTFADCPEWPFQPQSPLLAAAKEAFRDVHGKDVEVEVSHSSLELGIFASKIPGIEMVSVGPEAFDVHTTKERLNWRTVQPVWDAVTNLLGRLK